MKKIAKISVLTLAASTMYLAFGIGESQARPPAFYHYYYVYDHNMTWCEGLVKEVYRNANKNWHFTRTKVVGATAFFSVGDVVGSLRCLAKDNGSSWVVIVSSGNDAGKTKDLFNELRVGVCGQCAF